MCTLETCGAQRGVLYPAVDTDALAAAHVDVHLPPPRVLLRCNGEGAGSGGGGRSPGPVEGVHAGAHYSPPLRVAGAGGGGGGGGGGGECEGDVKVGVLGEARWKVDGVQDPTSGGARWRLAVPPSGDAAPPVIWVVPAGVRWHAPVVAVGTLAAQYAAAIAVIVAAVRAPGAGGQVPPRGPGANLGTVPAAGGGA
jgi:hypothetical protein